MMVTSFLNSARGLFSDYGRARYFEKGAAAASVKADAVRRVCDEVQKG